MKCKIFDILLGLSGKKGFVIGTRDYGGASPQLSEALQG